VVTAGGFASLLAVIRGGRAAADYRGEFGAETRRKPGENQVKVPTISSGKPLLAVIAVHRTAILT